MRRLPLSYRQINMAIKKILGIALVGLLGLTLNQAYGYHTLVNITGSVKAATCDLTSKESEDIKLGDIYLSSTGFGGNIGSTSEKKDWSITLKCPSDIPVIFIPEGNSYLGHSSVLALNAESGSATGVGIETEYFTESGNWKVLELNKRNEIIKTVKKDGDIAILMRGYYKQMEEKVTSGSANASMTIDIVYQ